MKHISVLKEESIENLNIKPDGIYVDATLGGAGHSKEILKRLPEGFLYAFDVDDYAISRAHEVLKDFSNYEIIKSNFRNLKEELHKREVFKIDGILFDLGLSSFQIDDKKRGFSYLGDNKLDMRMDQSQEFSALDILNNYKEEELVNIFFKYGEERNARKIAREIIKARPLSKTSELVEITDKVNYKTKGHSAKRVFQALRIEVNDELKALKEALESLDDMINPGGRICVISFHSLEDRIVKKHFRSLTRVEIIKGLPVPIEPESPFIEITRKPIYPKEEEMKTNSRSKSAKLRVIEKR